MHQFIIKKPNKTITIKVDNDFMHNIDIQTKDSKYEESPLIGTELQIPAIESMNFLISKIPIKRKPFVISLLIKRQILSDQEFRENANEYIMISNPCLANNEKHLEKLIETYANHICAKLNINENNIKQITCTEIAEDYLREALRLE